MRGSWHPLEGKGGSKPTPGREWLAGKTTWAKTALHSVYQRGFIREWDKAKRKPVLKPSDPDHFYTVCDLLVSSESARTMLYGDVINGVSLWVQSQSIRSHEVPLIRPAFAAIDFRLMRNEVAHYRIPERASQIAFMLAVELENHLTHIRSPSDQV